MNPLINSERRLYEAPECVVMSLQGLESVLIVTLSNLGEEGGAGDGFGGDNPIINPGVEF